MAANEPRWDARTEDAFVISHWRMTAADISRISSARSLTLWNVKFPAAFSFADLSGLSWLDMRGGSGDDLTALSGAVDLRGLSINQVRGLSDLTAISGLTGLRVLALYGLAQVTALPDLSDLADLRRLELGQLKNLTDWEALASAPALEELAFQNLLAPDLAIIDALSSHSSLREFEWWAPDVAQRTQDDVRKRLGLAKARAIRPEQWLEEESAD